MSTGRSDWKNGLVIQWITWSGSGTIDGVTYPSNLNFTEYFNYPNKNRDEFSRSAMGNGTKGDLVVRGEARYWAKAKITDIAFPNTQSGGLPTTPGNAFDQVQGNPLLSNPIIRSYRIVWDCSCPDKYDSKTIVTKLQISR